MLHKQLTRLGQLRRWTALALLVLSLTLSGCGSSEPSPLSGAWVGKVDGTDAFIAIASNGEEVMAYICDGQTITQWFRGAAATGELELAAEGASLQAQLSVDSASGSVTLADGRTFTFQAARAAGDSGLYRAEETVNGETWISGWVVLEDGQLRGARVSPARAIDPLSSLSVNATRIEPDLKPY